MWCQALRGKRQLDIRKLLEVFLLKCRKKIAEYLELLDSGKYTMEQVLEIVRFLQRRLCVRYENVKHLEDSELVVYLKHKLNRPIRVCGVVKNEGEPGGGLISHSAKMAQRLRRFSKAHR